MIPEANSICPHTGDGVNTWINSRVIFLLSVGIAPETILETVLSETARCGRSTEHDILHSLHTARNVVRSLTDVNPLVVPARLKQSTLPKLDEVFRAKILQTHKIHFETWGKISQFVSPRDALINLYDGLDNLVCVAFEKNQHVTAPLREILRVSIQEMQYIVPSPMLTQWGVTKDGHNSMRTLSNTARRWYLVVEFDSGSLDEQASLILHLSKYRRLKMIVFSGGKSLHAWFDVYGHSEKANKAFFARATILGADPPTWVRSQLCRIPGGTNRRSGRSQEIFYYSPLGRNK